MLFVRFRQCTGNWLCSDVLVQRRRLRVTALSLLEALATEVTNEILWFL